MSCIWSLATRFGYEDFEIRKKDVPGAANTTQLPESSTSTVDCFIGGGLGRSRVVTRQGSIGSNGLPAPELPAPQPMEEPARSGSHRRITGQSVHPAPELPAFSTDGEAARLLKPLRKASPNGYLQRGAEPCIEGGGGPLASP